MNTDVDWRFNAGPIDIDSELRNLNRAASRCPKDKFTPDCPDCDCGDTQGEPCGQGVVSGCKRKEGKMLTQGQMCGDQNLINFPTCHFSVEDSRLSNPPCTLRGTGWNSPPRAAMFRMCSEGTDDIPYSNTIPGACDPYKNVKTSCEIAQCSCKIALEELKEKYKDISFIETINDKGYDEFKKACSLGRSYNPNNN